MIDPFGLNRLNEVEQAEADRAEAYIDEQIRKDFDANPSQVTFEVKTADLAGAIGGLTLKVRAAVLKRYGDNKWKTAVDETRGVIVLNRPVRKCGGRPKGSKNAPKVTPVPAAEALAAEAPAAEALAEVTDLDPAEVVA